MCDTGSIMANQMDDLIEGGIREHDAMCDEIDYLKKKVKLMEEFLRPHELQVIERLAKNKDHEKE